MNPDYISGTQTIVEHDLTLAIPGDVESVRPRLVNALQQLGYKILGEQPLHAKRRRQGSARWDCSLSALDYPTALTVSLKQTNDVAVIAKFDYEVKSHVPMTRGDRQTLAREAEAIVALATERLALSACRACGTQVTDESHFCRRCGSPLVLDLPELELLRLTKGARHSYHSIVVGVVGLLLAMLTALPIFVVNGARIFAPLLWVGIPLGSYSLFLLLQGIRQLHQTLNPKVAKDRTSRPQPVLAASVTTALPPAQARASVIEGTTELLSGGRDRLVAEPISRKDPNTAEIDHERLM